jgi:GT2 family glycosyltransferase
LVYEANDGIVNSENSFNLALVEPLPADLDLVPLSRRPIRLAPVTLTTAAAATPAIPDGLRHAAAPREGRVSIIVVTHNNLPFTRLCVCSLLANTNHTDFELILVDNASTDTTVLFLRGLATQSAGIQLIENNANLGFAAANNHGIARATGEVIVLLNNDTIVPPNWLNALVAHLADPTIGAVGPVTNRGCNQTQVEVSYRTYGQFIETARDRATNSCGQAVDVPMIPMLCMAMRRDVSQLIGPLDENFGLGLFEDDDYAFRMGIANLRLICAEDVLIHHFGEASFGELAPSGAYAELLQANCARFETKWNVRWKPHEPRISTSYARMVGRVQAEIRSRIPVGETVVVVSKGDEALIDLNGRKGWHFPQNQSGGYSGHHPPDGATAVAELEHLRSTGSRWFVLPQTAAWWLEHYPDLRLHLQMRYRQVFVDPDVCTIFEAVSPT